jgi:mono/diheme cytochrome c family protein
MDHTHPQHPSRRAFRAFALSLSATTLALALAAGCGGAKPETTADAGAPPATEAPATPAPATGATAAAGSPEDIQNQYATKCASCHGPKGQGDGIAAKALNPKPRNFGDLEYMATRTDEQLSEVIRNGKGAMPKWGGILSDARIAGLVAHVRELGKTP